MSNCWYLHHKLRMKGGQFKRTPVGLQHSGSPTLSHHQFSEVTTRQWWNYKLVDIWKLLSHRNTRTHERTHAASRRTGALIALLSIQSRMHLQKRNSYLVSQVKCCFSLLRQVNVSSLGQHLLQYIAETVQYRDETRDAWIKITRTVWDRRVSLKYSGLFGRQLTPGSAGLSVLTD